MRLRTGVLCGLWLMALMLGMCSLASAAERPLPLEGRSSVYQRLVTHPGAKLYSGPEAGAQVLADPLRTFSVMYIYGRVGDRIRVGAGSDKADGWLD